MSYIKRALLSISRKKTKSLLLFLIIFILGNVMAGAIAIRQGADNVEKNIKQGLGAALTLEVDDESIDKYLQEHPEEMENFEYPMALEADLLKTVGQSAYVKSYDFTTQMNLGSESLEMWVDPQNAEWIGQDPHQKYWSFFLKGTQYAPVLTIKEGKSRLIDGRVFTPEEIENGSPVLLMTKAVAEKNQLKPGDKIVLSNYILDWSSAEGSQGPTVKEQRDLPFEIIGIYEDIEKPQSESAKDRPMMHDKQQSMNTFYVPNQIIIDERKVVEEIHAAENPEEITEEMRKRMAQVYYQSLYILDSPDNIEAFKQETQPLLPEHYIIRTNSDNFSVIAAPVEQTSKMAGYVLYVGIGASILIISLVVMLFLRDRKHELGIYMSLGERRSKVISQIVIEVMLVAILAVALSLITGNFVAQGLSDSMVRDQLVAEQDPFEHNPDIFMDQMRFGSFASPLEAEDIAENYRISFTPAYIGVFFLIGLGTALVSTLVPMLYIVRLNPKKVLM